MDRRSKRNLENSKEKNYTTWIILALIVVGIITFTISYTLYGKRVERQGKLESISDNTFGNSNNLLSIMPNEEVAEVSLEIGKSVNELQNDTEQAKKENNEPVEKIAVNTSEIENRVVAQRQENKEMEPTTSEIHEEEEQSEVNPTFIKPVDGEIIKDYAKDNLVYSNTLQEWTTHLGIDFAAEKTSIVKAAADGKIKSIKNDPRYGLTIVIEHANGFTSMYANLLSTEFVAVGEEVKEGQTIATVGNTATFEIADETHLHFEIRKDGISVDPNLYIK